VSERYVPWSLDLLLGKQEMPGKSLARGNPTSERAWGFTNLGCENEGTPSSDDDSIIVGLLKVERWLFLLWQAWGKNESSSALGETWRATTWSDGLKGARR